MPDTNDRDRFLGRVLEMQEGQLDPNLVAAYVDGALSQDEHDHVGRRLAADPEAMLIVRDLRGARRRQRMTWTLVAAAAVVLVALAIRLGVGGEAGPGLDFDARLTLASAGLKTAEPERFAEFAILTDEELAVTSSIPRGGTTTWLGPVGLLLDAPTAFQWRLPEGAHAVRLTVAGEGTRWEEVVESDRVGAPPLPPGRYVVTLRPLGALAGQPLRRTFEVASPDVRAHHREATSSILANAPPDLAGILVAHYALRNHLYAEARDALTHLLPGDPDGTAATTALHTFLDARAPIAD